MESSGGDSRTSKVTCKCRHLVPFKKGKFEVLVWALGGCNSKYQTTEMDFIVDPRLGEISAWPCLVVA